MVTCKVFEEIHQFREKQFLDVRYYLFKSFKKVFQNTASSRKSLLGSYLSYKYPGTLFYNSNFSLTRLLGVYRKV